MSQLVIADASCLIALDKIGHLFILKELFTQVFTTSTVASEYGQKLHYWISIGSIQDHHLVEKLENILDKGEASAIALAVETPDSILIIDERKGRKVALELGLDIYGTLKIILLAKQRGIIDRVEPLLKALEQNHFRFSKEIVKTILILAKEE